jgi:signal transduction histidine kinase
MNLRIKYVVIITLVAAVIQLSSVLIIYYLYAGVRRDDFEDRLWTEAVNTYRNHYHISGFQDSSNTHVMDESYVHSVLDESEITILDDQYNVVLTMPTGFHYIADRNFLKKVREEKEVSFEQEEKEGLGIYINGGGKQGYVIISAYDKEGFYKLKRVRLILMAVAFGAALITALFSFFFIMSAAKPLVKLSLQMRHLNENNLKERFDIPDGNIKHNEIVQIATNFNGMLERLEKAFSKHKSFVHHASHELRTPLARMLTQTEVALMNDITIEEARSILTSLKDDQEELIELTNSLLLLSQYERIPFSTDWPVIRLDEVVYEAVAEAGKSFSDIHINMEFEKMPQSEQSLSLRGNDSLLSSAFRNLLKNAYQYSVDKKVQIVINVVNDDLLISFRNHGPVLEANDSERLFIPFFRGDNAQHKRGHGLGLSIVKRIIELHKGVIKYKALDENTNDFTVIFKRSLAE